MARLSPGKRRVHAAIGKQTYKATPTITGDRRHHDGIRAIVARRFDQALQKRQLIAAGLLSDSVGFFAQANSNGNFAYQKSTA